MLQTKLFYVPEERGETRRVFGTNITVGFNETKKIYWVNFDGIIVNYKSQKSVNNAICEYLSCGMVRGYFITSGETVTTEGILSQYGNRFDPDMWYQIIDNPTTKKAELWFFDAVDGVKYKTDWKGVNPVTFWGDIEALTNDEVFDSENYTIYAYKCVDGKYRAFVNIDDFIKFNSANNV